jgi:hypothetical protein
MGAKMEVKKTARTGCKVVGLRRLQYGFSMLSVGRYHGVTTALIRVISVHLVAGVLLLAVMHEGNLKGGKCQETLPFVY